MDKNKNVILCLVALFLFVTGLTLIQAKHRNDMVKKFILSKQIRVGLEFLMVDLLAAKQSSIHDVPADGQWHHKIIFNNLRHGPMEYLLQNGHLVRINQNRATMLADHIDDFEVRRQTDSPQIIEVQIMAKTNVTLKSNLKIRMFQ